MKTLAPLAVLAFLLAAPAPCFALWEIDTVTKERAKEIGIEVRSTKVPTNHVRVELEFKVAGVLKEFDGPAKVGSRVELRVGKGDNPPVTAALREDRSKPGRVLVSFVADRAELDKLTLWIMIPEPLGGTIYDVQVKDFVD